MHVRAEARPVMDGDTITHIVIAFIDISREVEAEAARSESEQRVRQLQRMDPIGTLAGGIAHDFNNLLAAVKMMAAVLRRNEDDATKLGYLEQIDEVTDSAAQLTRALLGFARRGNISRAASRCTTSPSASRRSCDGRSIVASRSSPSSARRPATSSEIFRSSNKC